MAGKLWMVASIATAACWGMTYMLAGKILQHTDRNIYLMLTSMVNLMFFTGLAVHSSAFTGITTTGWCLLGIASILSVLGNALSLYSIELADPVRAASIEVTYPAWCMLFSMLFIGDMNITWKTYLAIGFIMSGVLIFVTESGGH